MGRWSRRLAPLFVDHAGAAAGERLLEFGCGTGNKIMTTSGGGALLTDDGDFAQRIRYLATQARQPAAHYEHTEIGYNYRMSNLMAGLGRAQLVRLPEMIERRRQWRRRYRDLFADVAGVDLFGAPGGVDDPINLVGQRVAAWVRQWS
jgi:dTDP-4-amino-4,6-dideoxygalactose transaminase